MWMCRSGTWSGSIGGKASNSMNRNSQVLGGLGIRMCRYSAAIRTWRGFWRNSGFHNSANKQAYQRTAACRGNLSMVSRSQKTLNALGEIHFGAVSIFVNATNLTNVRQTRFDPLTRTTPGLGGTP